MDSQTKHLYELKAQVLQALAHPIRLAIADALADGEVCVCELAERVDAQRSNVSRHLAIMQNAGVVESRKEGLMVFYSLKTPCILKFFTCVSDVLRHNHERTAKLLKQL